MLQYIGAECFKGTMLPSLVVVEVEEVEEVEEEENRAHTIRHIHIHMKK